jgi:hypothetical protein
MQEGSRENVGGVAELERGLRKVNPDFPFHYSFSDQQYESAFESPAKNS